MHAVRSAAAACVLTAAVGIAPAGAQVFKCVDPGGQVTYQEAPCPPAQRGGALELLLDNGSARDTPELEARWKALAEQHDVAPGMPKRWVQASLGVPASVRRAVPAERASEVWSYTTASKLVRVGFAGDVVAWSRAEPATSGPLSGAGDAAAAIAPRGGTAASPAGASDTGSPGGGEQADAMRSRVAAERNCDDVVAELGPPSAQEPARISVGTGGALRSAEGVRYTYEPVPNGLPARLSFVCVEGKVVSVARDVPR